MSYVDIELRSSLEIDGAQVKTLRLREPTVGDQLASEEIKGSEAAKEIAMLSNLCEISPNDIKRMKLHDYKKLQAAFVGFLE